jgi:4-hydroxybenzoate polyprenyltransferase
VSPLRATIKGWLELLRPPNLFTVPGDPLAGFLLAGGTEITPALCAAAAACFLYVAGLIWNDYADAAEDAQTRPDRPIPSDRVKRTHACIMATLLTVAGVVSAWLISPLSGCFAAILAILVLAYNFIARKSKVIGVITMGLCRGTSLLLGATAALGQLPTNRSPWVAAAGLTLYIIMVSLIAYGETHKQRLGSKPWLPVALATALVVWAMVHSIWAAAIAIFTVLWLTKLAWTLRGEAQPVIVQKTIGCMIRTLLPMQAALCATVPEVGYIVAIVLLVMWPTASLVGKWFYGS